MKFQYILKIEYLKDENSRPYWIVLKFNFKKCYYKVYDIEGFWSFDIFYDLFSFQIDNGFKWYIYLFFRFGAL